MAVNKPQRWQKLMSKHVAMMSGRRLGKTQMANWEQIRAELNELYRLEIDTGTVYGQEYYTVMPKGWMWRDFEWNDLREWCDETFGPTPADGIWTPDQRWYVNSERFWFKNQKDRDWFVLRWS
jgi:hypothetical protein